MRTRVLGLRDEARRGCGPRAIFCPATMMTSLLVTCRCTVTGLEVVRAGWPRICPPASYARAGCHSSW